jgi:flagellin
MIVGAGRSSLDAWAETSVNNAFMRLARVSEKLATLNRINRGSDDPAGLIAAEQLNLELASLDRAAESLDRTRALVRVADSGLAHASALITEMHSNVVAAANDSLTPEQRDALQYEVDAAIDALDRLGQSTFGGQPVFGQTLDFLVGNQPHQLASVDIVAVDESLGGSSGVLADLRSGGVASLQGGDLEVAANILGEAHSQVLSARAELGTFERYSIDSTQRQLEDAQVQLAGALSAIRDTDFAAESSNLVREMILADTAVATAKLSLRVRRNSLTLLDSVFDVFG